jgi:hypothetical protein
MLSNPKLPGGRAASGIMKYSRYNKKVFHYNGMDGGKTKTTNPYEVYNL